MKILTLLLSLVLLESCARNEKEELREPVKEAGKDLADIPFKKLPYNFRYYFFDSISKSIIPDKHYQYWAYIAYNHPYKKKFAIIKEGGNTKMRPVTVALPPTLGFFHGGHPNFVSNFAVVIQNDSLQYITTATGFREFVGTIDNLDEAVLVAMSYEYSLSYEEDAYRIVNDNYQFRMRRVFNHMVSRSNDNIITVRTDGFVKITADDTNGAKKSAL